MRRITAIPSSKITFHNVPVSGLFFLKRTLYRKISSREASCYNDQSQIFFEPKIIVKHIAKQHENLALEVYESKIKDQTEVKDFKVNDTVEILKKNIFGKVVSVNNNTCLVQYKNKSCVSFDEFSKSDLRNLKNDIKG